MRMKKFLSALLVFSVLLGIFAIPSYATDGKSPITIGDIAETISEAAETLVENVKDTDKPFIVKLREFFGYYNIGTQEKFIRVAKRETDKYGHSYKLKKDIKIKKPVTITDKFVLDGNGKTITTVASDKLNIYVFHTAKNARFHVSNLNVQHGAKCAAFGVEGSLYMTNVNVNTTESSYLVSNYGYLQVVGSSYSVNKPGNNVCPLLLQKNSNTVFYSGSCSNNNNANIAVGLHGPDATLTSYSASIGRVSVTQSNNNRYYKKFDNYNIKDETYSFVNNFSKSMGCGHGGHCFGMSMTSAAFHIGELDIRGYGGNENKDLYSLGNTSALKNLCCYAQETLCMGFYKGTNWNEIISFLKQDSDTYNYEGHFVIAYYYENYKGGIGHAVNYIHYKNVNGQDRLYAYDNNHPEKEVYLYCKNGKIYNSEFTAEGAVDIYLIDVPRTYKAAYSKTNLVAEQNTVSVENVTPEGCVEFETGTLCEEFEMSEGVTKVKITPLVDNAEFEYRDHKFSFGKINADTYGELTLLSDTSVVENSDDLSSLFRIVNG